MEIVEVGGICGNGEVVRDAVVAEVVGDVEEREADLGGVLVRGGQEHLKAGVGHFIEDDGTGVNDGRHAGLERVNGGPEGVGVGEVELETCAPCLGLPVHLRRHRDHDAVRSTTASAQSPVEIWFAGGRGHKMCTVRSDNFPLEDIVCA